MSHEKEIRDAVIARIGADRMAMGLGCIPDKISGDLEIVDKLQTENKRLKKALERFGHHDGPCLVFIDEDECICGFTQSLQETSNE